MIKAFGRLNGDIIYITSERDTPLPDGYVRIKDGGWYHPQGEPMFAEGAIYLINEHSGYIPISGFNYVAPKYIWNTSMEER
jgi:hypothetical protein